MKNDRVIEIVLGIIICVMLLGISAAIATPILSSGIGSLPTYFDTECESSVFLLLFVAVSFIVCFDVPERIRRSGSGSFCPPAPKFREKLGPFLALCFAVIIGFAADTVGVEARQFPTKCDGVTLVQCVAKDETAKYEQMLRRLFGPLQSTQEFVPALNPIFFQLKNASKSCFGGNSNCYGFVQRGIGWVFSELEVRQIGTITIPGHKGVSVAKILKLVLNYRLYGSFDSYVNDPDIGAVYSDQSIGVVVGRLPRNQQQQKLKQPNTSQNNRSISDYVVAVSASDYDSQRDWRGWPVLAISFFLEVAGGWIFLSRRGWSGLLLIGCSYLIIRCGYFAASGGGWVW